MLVDAVGPVLATLRHDRLPLHIEHLPERFGLLVILVLGEAVGGAARGTHDASWAGPSVAVGVLGLLLAASLWWAYFDVAATSSAGSLERTAAEDGEQDGDDDPETDDEPPDTSATTCSSTATCRSRSAPSSPVGGSKGWPCTPRRRDRRRRRGSWPPGSPSSTPATR